MVFENLVVLDYVIEKFYEMYVGWFVLIYLGVLNVFEFVFVWESWFNVVDFESFCEFVECMFEFDVDIVFYDWMFCW